MKAATAIRPRAIAIGLLSFLVAYWKVKGYT